MDELKTEYTVLFNGITETIKGLEGVIRRLEMLQQAAENTYLDSFDEQDRKKNEKKGQLVLLEREAQARRCSGNE